MGTADEAASMCSGLLLSLCGAVGVGRQFPLLCLEPDPIASLLPPAGYSANGPLPAFRADVARLGSSFRHGHGLGMRWRLQAHRLGAPVAAAQEKRNLSIQAAGISGLLAAGAAESAVPAAGTVAKRLGVSRAFGDAAWHGSNGELPSTDEGPSGLGWVRRLGSRAAKRARGAFLSRAGAAARAAGLRTTPHDRDNPLPSESVKVLGPGGHLALEMLAHLSTSWPIATWPLVSRVASQLLRLPTLSNELRREISSLIQASRAAVAADLALRIAATDSGPDQPPKHAKKGNEKKESGKNLTFDEAGLAAGAKVACAAAGARSTLEIVASEDASRKALSPEATTTAAAKLSAWLRLNLPSSKAIARSEASPLDDQDGSIGQLAQSVHALNQGLVAAARQASAVLGT